MKPKVYWVVFASFSLFFACSSAPKSRVVETDKGNKEVIGIAKDEADARLAAVDRATELCSLKKETPIFRENQIEAGAHRHLDLNLKNIPVIGKVLKGEDQTQVILAFRCAGEYNPA